MQLDELQAILHYQHVPLFFGGSFNPFHRGHKAIIMALCRYFPTCPITLVPNRISPLKSQEIILPSQKMAMMQAVMQDLYQESAQEFTAKNLRLELCELLRDGASYTADTIRYQLQNNQMQTASPKLCLLVMGWDSLCTITYWKDWLYLLETCIILVFSRKSADMERIPCDILSQTKYMLLELDEPYSSSAIRNQLKQRPKKLSTSQKVEWENLLGVNQFSYIQQQGLYL